jgi:DNA-binding NtrC family response regulator
MDHPTVLLVDDNDELRELVTRVLEGEGYSVASVASVTGARASSAIGPQGMRLLIADVVLQDGNGLELARELLCTVPGLQVIVMSGMPLLASELGHGVAFIAKPFMVSQLLAMVADALAPAG